MVRTINRKVCEIKLKKLKEFLIKIGKACPLATFLVVSTIGFTIAGLIVFLTAKEELAVTMERPLFSTVLASGSGESSLLADEEPDYSENDEQTEDEKQMSNEGQKSATEDENAENPLENTGVMDGAYEEETYPTRFEKKKKEKSKYFTDLGKVALTTDYPYVSVKKDYFDDALFIGDSRIEGLKLYSGLDNAKFYCKEGISLNKILTEKFVKIKIKGEKKTVSIKRALKEKEFGKIYIMIGINEITYRDNKDFKEKYSEVLEEIKALQPNAKIVLMGIMKVTNQYAKENPGFSNGNINAKNVMIAELADGKNVFYMDFNPEICDSKGGVKKSYTWDGVHLKAEYYSIWVKFLKKHGFQ